MRNGWTGGQYSLVRALFGAYLFVHFLQLVPYGPELFSSAGVLPDASLSPLTALFPNVLNFFDGPAFVVALLILGCGLAVSFAVGWHDRIAAIGLWYIWAALFGRNPLIANPGIPYVGWLLIAHVFLPAAPFGSIAARRRIDPGGGWRMPSAIFAVAWILMALGYSYSGVTKLVSPSWIDGSALKRVLENPLARPHALRDALLVLPDVLARIATWGALALELLFAPLALSRRVRPWLWLAMVGMHLSLITLLDFADLTMGMLMLHLFTFDPAWIRPVATSGTDRVFYDGDCGLCQASVRLLLAEDRSGNAFRFAPLQGETFAAAFPPGDREALPDSIVLLTSEGEFLTRTRAVLRCLRRLGGLWRVLSWPLALVPGVVADRGYDLVAAIRHRLFRRPDEACPILPPKLRARFDP
jgi:predicted DCC family thiol-disulfide oxidoreductase YuxK